MVIPVFFTRRRAQPRARAAMALSKLSGDQHCSVFGHLCNVLEPRTALDFSSASLGLWETTQAMRQQLRSDHEAAAALCRKVGMHSCKELREAKMFMWIVKLSPVDLALLGRLGSVLPALEKLDLINYISGGPEAVQRLAVGLGAGALPAVTTFKLTGMRGGDAGASALATILTCCDAEV